jgi:hypothetical protein
MNLTFEITPDDRRHGISFMKHAGAVTLWFSLRDASHSFHIGYLYNDLLWGSSKDDCFSIEFGLGRLIRYVRDTDV